MSDQFPEDPVERRIAAAFTAFATTEVPASAPRPGRAPRPVDRPATHRGRRWGIAGGSLLVAAAAVVLALLLGTEVFDARVAPTAPPATEVTTANPAPSSTVPLTAPAPSTTAPGPGAVVTTAPAATVPRPAGPGTSGGGPVPCTAADTRVGVDGDDGGGEHSTVLIHLTNTSTTPCVTTGYPGVALLDAQGRQIVQAQRTPRGYWGGAEPSTITLAPGAEATAILEGLAFDPATGDVCASAPTGLLVTAPDDTRSVTVPHRLSGMCAEVEVHPLVAGGTGNLPG